MLRPADASIENEDGRSACLTIMYLVDRPFDFAMVMKSSCSVLIRSPRSSRKYTAMEPNARAIDGQDHVVDVRQGLPT